MYIFKISNLNKYLKYLNIEKIIRISLHKYISMETIVTE